MTSAIALRNITLNPEVQVGVSGIASGAPHSKNVVAYSTAITYRIPAMIVLVQKNNPLTDTAEVIGDYTAIPSSVPREFLSRFSKFCNC